MKKLLALMLTLVVGGGIAVIVSASQAGASSEFTLVAHETNVVAGTRFWILIRHPSALRLTLDGKAVSLPARKTLKVLVTRSRTALAG